MNLTSPSLSQTIRKTEGRPSAPGLIQFDLDGTLLNTQQHIYLAMNYAVRECFHKEFSDEELMSKVGIPLYTQMEYFCPENPQLACELYRSYQAQLSQESITVYPGIRELLDRLYAEGFLLAVVSSKSHEPACRQLSEHQLISYFRMLVGGDDVPYAKPDPYPLIYTAQTLAVPLQKTVYIGDSPFDIQAARSAGVFSVAVDWGIFPRTQLMQEKPDYLVSHAHELLGLIHELNLNT